MKNLFDIIYKHPWIIIVGLLLIPVITCAIVTTKAPLGLSVGGDVNSWVSFYGNYFGAIFGSIIGAVIGANMALRIVDTERNDRAKEQQLTMKITNTCEYIDLYYTFYDKIFLIKHLAVHFHGLAKENKGIKLMLADKEALETEIKNYHMCSLKLTAFMKMKGKLITEEDAYNNIYHQVEEIKRSTKEFLDQYYIYCKHVLGTSEESSEVVDLEEYIKRYSAHVEDFQKSMDNYNDEIIQVKP